MPRTVAKDLLVCYRRANPITQTRVEVSAPDLENVLRRADQFANSTPAAAFATGAAGGAEIPSTSSTLANFPNTSGFYNLAIEDPQRRLKGMAWTLDPAFVRAKLRTFTAYVARVPKVFFYYNVDFQLQVYRVTRTPGLLTQNNATTAFNDYTFSPLLASPPVIKASNVVWSGSGTQTATLNFDLSNYGLLVENVPGQASGPGDAGELPTYYFVVTILGNIKPNDVIRWLCDTSTSRTVGGVGSFQRVFWARENSNEQWQQDTAADVPSCAIKYDGYSASAQGVYDIDLGNVPDPSSTVRAMFERSIPAGTAATLEVSTTSATGPWTAINNADVIATKQQEYWLRLTLTSDAAHRATPTVNTLGIESRVPVDVTLESIVELPTRTINAPWLTAEVSEAKLGVIRSGRRDYRDAASVLGSQQPPTKLEADFYLTANHPNVSRADWLMLERMPITDRQPSSTGEDFTLLSYASRLKKKIPTKSETINTVHTVTSSTTAAVLVDAGTPLIGGPYDGKGYYMRIRSVAAGDLADGQEYTIAGSTTVSGAERQLDFSPALPDVLAAGDIIEVHSGIYNTADAQWADQDPSFIWTDILSNYLGIPPDRLGAGFLPRMGVPPRVQDRAPGDATTQSKLKVTFKLKEQEEAGKLLDQLSFIMGGATVEIGGQICFVQIYPLRAADGSVTVPLSPVSGIFDARDITGLQPVVGLESRGSAVTCDYGVNALAAAEDNTSPRTTLVANGDAVNWLGLSDLDQASSAAAVPSDISRWIYNSIDAGLFLAGQCADQVNRATATGLRVWSGQFTEAHPELIPGDVIIVITDAYTDHDPATVSNILGPIAVRGVIVGCGANGTTFSIFIVGLTDNVASLAGSRPGENAGLGIAPGAPQVSVGFDSSNRGVVTVFLGTRASSSRLLIDDAPISDATLLASAIINGVQYSSTFLSPIFTAGTTLYGKIIEYTGPDGTGTFGNIYAFTQPRGTGVSVADVGGIALPFAIDTSGLLGERLIRSNQMAGVGTQGGAFSSDPLYDFTGGEALIDPVTQTIQSALLAADGRATPDSTYGVNRKSANAAGAAAQGGVMGGLTRAGNGGVVTPGGRIITDPYYSADGSDVLLDPETSRIGSSLSGPTGIASSVFERGGYKGDNALDGANKLVTGITGTAVIVGTAASTIERGGNKADNAIDTHNRIVDQLHQQMTTVGGLRSIQDPPVPLSHHTFSNPLLPDIVSMIADIAAHTLQVGTTSISYNSGTVSLGLYSPLSGGWDDRISYIYADDPLYQGSGRSDTAYYAITVAPGTSPDSLTAIEGRYFVGKIVFDSSGGVSYHGNGGGGGTL